MTEQVICPDCGKKVKNLGSHQYHSHKDIEKTDIVVDNHIKDKPLSELLESIKNILKPYPSVKLSVNTIEEGGVFSRVDISIGIQLRR